MGGKNTRSEATRLAGIPIQTSMYGRVIPKVWGTGRVSANLVWYNGFQAISHVSKTKTGGKGGGTNTNTTYTYTASIILGISQGPIASIRKVYRDKTVFTNGAQTALQQAGLSLSSGAIGQSVWPYLTNNYSSQAIGYSGLAYAYAANYSLGDNAQLTNHGFEVVSTVKESGRDDAAPAAIIADALNMVPLWQSAMLADTTAFNNYTKAADIWLSPVLESAVPAKDFIQQILKVTNCEAVWSAGQLKFIPYTDVSLTANGATFTPDLTPLYDIDDSVTTDKGSDDPIEYELGRDADAYNYITINYLDRSRDYADASIPGTDLASIVEYGNRKADPYDYKMICETSVAANVAQLLVTRTSVMRRKFKLSLPPQYFLLEPMDLITVTRANLGLDRELCRVLDTDEDEDGDITVTIEEVLAGAAAGAIITRQPSSGYIPNYDVDSGNANAPIIIQPPRQMTEGSLEMWIAAAGGSNWGGADIWVSLDGLSYERRGQVKSGCRYGVTTSALAIASDPQNGTLGINIGTTGTIDPATQAEFDAGVTLCMIDQEVIAYRDATLTGTGQYTLGQLRRGLFGTTIANHSSGAPFARLDAAVATIPFDKQNIGKTVYIKLQSFNIYGRKYQDISTLTAYQAVIGQSGSMYVSTGAASQIGTNVILPDGSVPPQSRLDNTQQQWTDVNNRPTTLAALDSAANTLVTGLNTEVENARNGAANLLTSVQNAASTATWTNVAGRPTTLSGLDATAASSLNTLTSQMSGIGTNSGAVLTALNSKLDVSVATATYATAANLTTLSAQIGGAFAVMPTLAPSEKTWTENYTASPSATFDLPSATVTTGVYTKTAAAGLICPKAYYNLTDNTIFEVIGDIEYVSGTAPFLYLNGVSFDAGDVLSASPYSNATNTFSAVAAGRYRYKARFGKNAVAGSWAVVGNEITYSGVFAWGAPTTAKKIRFAIGWGGGGGNTVVKIYQLTVNDVSSLAKSEANITSLAATEATHYSALSTLTTNLTAKTTQGEFETLNGGFDIYPTATDAPTSWGRWGSSNTAYYVRVSDNNGGYACQVTGAAGVEIGLSQTIPDIFKIGDYAVLQATFRLDAGTTTGAGIWLDYLPTISTGLIFASELDAYGNKLIDNNGLGTVGKTYTVSKLVKIASSNASAMYGMTHWGNYGSVANANQITWFKLGIRKASDAEIKANKALLDPMGTGTTLISTITNEQIARANGDSALSTSITTLTAKVSSNNLLPRVNYNLGTTGWNNALNGQLSAQFGTDIAGNDWRINGVANIAIHQPDEAYQGQSAYWATDVNGDAIVKENQWVNVSVLAAAHRCGVQLHIYQYNVNAAGAYTFITAIPVVNNAPLIGGIYESNWSILSKTLQLASNCNRLRLFFLKNATNVGQGNSYAWFCKPMVCEVVANAPDTRPPYNEGSNSGSITDTKTALTTLDGRVSLYYGMKLDGNGVTSFELMNGTNVPYGGIAKLTASKFLIYGDTIVSGTITADKITAGTITADKIVDNSLTKKASYSSVGNTNLATTYNGNFDTSPTSWTQIGTLTVTVVKDILLQFSTNLVMQAAIDTTGGLNVPVPMSQYLRLKRDGTVIKSYGNVQSMYSGYQKQGLLQSAFALDSPTAGSHTYSLEAACVSWGNGSFAPVHNYATETNIAIVDFVK